MTDTTITKPRPGDRDAPRKNRIAATAQKFWFAIAFLVGAAGLGYVRYRLSDDHQYYGEIWAVAVMGMYVAVSLTLRGLTLRNDQTGDNVYYLGFLFTLSSLALALIEFTEDLKTEKIVSSFGVALVATVAGIVMRIVINSWREDPVEIEESARKDLAQSARNLKAVLDRVVSDMNSFSRETRQSIQDTLTELVTKTNATVADSIEKLASNNQRVIDRIDEAFKDFTDNSKRLNSISSKTVVAIEKLMEKVSDIEAPPNLILEMFEPFDRSISSLTAALDNQSAALEKIIGQLRGSSDDFTKAGASVRASVSELGGAIESIKAFTRSIAEQQNEISGSTESIAALRSGVQALTETIGTSLRGLPQAMEAEVSLVRRHVESLASELERSRGMTEQVQASLVETVRALRASV